MVGERLGAGGRDFEPRRVSWAQEQFLAGNLAPVEDLVRSEVAESWALSASQVPTGLSQAPFEQEAPERWQAGPIARAFAPLADDLAAIAVDGDFVAAVTDESGAIVWMAGGTHDAPAGRTGGLHAWWTVGRGGGRHERPRSRPAHREALVRPGHGALRADGARLGLLLGPDHLAVHRAHLGVLDLSTTWGRANPLALSTVTALARNVELILSADRSLHLAAQVGLRLDVLGGGAVHHDGRRLAVPPRQLELMTILSLHPGGLTLEGVHDRLHGDRPANPGTTKAELSHLRKAIEHHLASRPYRLEGGWSSDHDDVLDALRTGRLDDAVALYRGPLLPRSEAPAIEEHRVVLETAIRTAVIADPTPARLAALCHAIPGDPYLSELAAGL